MNLEHYGVAPEKGRKYENIIYALALVYNMMEREISAYFAANKFSAPKFNVLMAAAYQNKGAGVSQVELGRRLIVSAGNITKIVDSLCKEKLISRVQNKENRRENIIKITPKGMKMIDKLWPGYDNLAKTLTELIAKDKRELSAEILKNWFNALQERNSRED